ncbi:SusC/RagA family TonB-linked outer membrane protein [Bacteroidia bacterium]|nr:SusC/RagA family TonB-linked outer membrane protein [Bacteroidia bacterium]
MAKLLIFFLQSFFLSRKNDILLLIVLCSLPVLAQQGGTNIQGQVLDEKTREPIIGATISLVNQRATEGTVTDLDGKFTIRVNSLPATINVQFLGYKTENIAVYEYSKPLVISLREEANALSEIVVVGYGTQKRKELTGAVSSVSDIALSQQTISFDQALAGAVAGLNVTQSSGQPGATSTIRIRGSNSIAGSNEPLYVIDGFLLYNNSSATRTNVGGTTSGSGNDGTPTAGTFDGGLNPLTSINTADIESIEVLKDVSATAIYGSRGANGVIIITTKKGKRGRNTVNYQSSIGSSQVSNKLKLLDAPQWVSLHQEIDNYNRSPYDPANPYDVSRLNPHGITSDWQEAVLQTAVTQNHQISVSGGADDYRYLISGSYTDQKGIIRNTGLSRYIGRVNLDKDLSSKLNVGTNVTIGRTLQKGLTNQGNNSNFGFALRTSPLVPIYSKNSDDGYNYYNPFDASDLRIGDSSVNPLSDLLKSTVESRNISVIGNVYAQYAIIPELVAKINAGADINHVTQNYYAPATSAQGLLVHGYGAVGNKDYLSSLVELTLNYKKRFAEVHSFEALVGLTTQHTEWESTAAGASGFNNEALTYHSLQSANQGYTPITGAAEANLNSALGRINYSLLDRYNATLSLRADGSSHFPKGHQWGYFPSLGLSWNIDQEPFFKSSVISDLKLRGSAGQVGNQEIGDYLFSRSYTPRNYSFGNKIAVGYSATNYGNDDLKWETTTQYNIGTDIGLWKGRLSFTLDAYYKKTTDLLVNLPVERTTGLSTKMVNIGDISNKGLEFSVNANILDRRDLQWKVLANIATNVNTIERLGTDYFVVDEIILVQEGESLGTFFGYEFAGLVQQGEEASTPAPTWTSKNQAGDPKFVNKDGDPNVIDEDDKAVLGSVQPKFTYGFSTSLNYRKFDFSASFQGSYGNHLYNALRHNLETPSHVYNGSSVLADRWTPAHTNTDVPRAVAVPYVTLDGRYIEDASYLRLKDITLGYSFRVNTGGGSPLNFRVFASAQNLLTITNYTGYDPEASRNGGDETNGLLQGIDRGAYPTSKTFLGGLSLSF